MGKKPFKSDDDLQRPKRKLKKGGVAVAPPPFLKPVPVQYQTTARCPVCKQVLTTITHEGPAMPTMSASIPISAAREEHRQISPMCARHPKWETGWTEDPAVKVEKP